MKPGAWYNEEELRYIINLLAGSNADALAALELPVLTARSDLALARDARDTANGNAAKRSAAVKSV